MTSPSVPVDVTAGASTAPTGTEVQGGPGGKVRVDFGVYEVFNFQSEEVSATELAEVVDFENSKVVVTRSEVSDSTPEEVVDFGSLDVFVTMSRVAVDFTLTYVFDLRT